MAGTAGRYAKRGLYREQFNGLMRKNFIDTVNT
ncbi:hypothetical protein KIPB_014003, partial [Kipferlia bialata]|eukprot:g14003.t1